jgi:hypothetical protein
MHEWDVTFERTGFVEIPIKFAAHSFEHLQFMIESFTDPNNFGSAAKEQNPFNKNHIIKITRGKAITSEATAAARV